MGKAQSIADRIREAKKQLDKDMDGVASKLDQFDALRPKVVGSVHAFVDAQTADVNELHDTLRQLSNLPFESEESSGDSGKTAGALKQPEPAQTPPGGAAIQRPFPGQDA